MLQDSFHYCRNLASDTVFCVSYIPAYWHYKWVDMTHFRIKVNKFQLKGYHSELLFWFYNFEMAIVLTFERSVEVY